MPNHEEYIESIIIRKDNQPEVTIPTFVDEDVDAIFEFEGKIKLTSIQKSIQNASHSRHTYVFEISSIDKMQKEE
ncbi:hypothetical protein LCGC14_2668060 [marine sediment metagenome]|uniref:Uncharacterized protein n=1 Tax=marine sediment metagenome TaxID=412755 RepID=A0A0F9CGV2_9ZZZZ